MTATTSRHSLSWSARLLVGLVLILVGAAVAVWGLAHYPPAARFLGVAAPAPAAAQQRLVTAPNVPAVEAEAAQAQRVEAGRVEALEARLKRLENATAQVRGSAGRADALVVAFATRRAVDRGVALGYLETLLVERFGQQHQPAVATIITGSHKPVRLQDLIAEYETLGPTLRSGGPQESWWDGFRRSLGSLVEIHRAEQPPVNVEARFTRALERLSSGDVDQALAETMRMPGAARAGPWIDKARRYVATHRALDEIESGALLTPKIPSA
jgi:hypothetical protein